MIYEDNYYYFWGHYFKTFVCMNFKNYIAINMFFYTTYKYLNWT